VTLTIEEPATVGLNQGTNEYTVKHPRVGSVPNAQLTIRTARYAVGRYVSGFANVPNGEIMDKNRLEPREMTVKNVKKFVGGYPEDTVHALQQMLMAFGVHPKMERILWATLKKEHLKRKEHSEKNIPPAREDFGKLSAEKQAEVKKNCAEREKEQALEQEMEMPVIGLCPVCEGALHGQVIPKCEQKKSGRIFYKECQSCTYYAEMFRKGTELSQVEGG
jgi:hypothetical protein